MNYSRMALLGAIFTIGAGPLLAGSPDEIRYKWGELGPIVTHRKVSLALPTGTRIEGRVLRVEADGLRMRVSRTSDRRAVAKGVRVIPRPSVSVLAVTDYCKLARLGFTLGAMALAGGIVASQNINLYEGPVVIIVPAVCALGIAVSGVAGYFIGKRLDKRVTYIRVVPGN